KAAERLVPPIAWSSATAPSARDLCWGAKGVEASSTDASVENSMIARRSSGPSDPIRAAAASRARSILVPDIDPDRSTISTAFTRTRGRRAPASASAVRSTWRYALVPRSSGRYSRSSIACIRSPALEAVAGGGAGGVGLCGRSRAAIAAAARDARATAKRTNVRRMRHLRGSETREVGGGSGLRYPPGRIRCWSVPRFVADRRNPSLSTQDYSLGSRDFIANYFAVRLVIHSRSRLNSINRQSR